MNENLRYYIPNADGFNELTYPVKVLIHAAFILTISYSLRSLSKFPLIANLIETEKQLFIQILIRIYDEMFWIATDFYLNAIFSLVLQHFWSTQPLPQSITQKSIHLLLTMTTWTIWVDHFTDERFRRIVLTLKTRVELSRAELIYHHWATTNGLWQQLMDSNSQWTPSIKFRNKFKIFSIQSLRCSSFSTEVESNSIKMINWVGLLMI